MCQIRESVGITQKEKTGERPNSFVWMKEREGGLGRRKKH